jgi:hypothetical protein
MALNRPGAARTVQAARHTSCGEGHGARSNNLRACPGRTTAVFAVFALRVQTKASYRPDLLWGHYGRRLTPPPRGPGGPGQTGTARRRPRPAPRTCAREGESAAAHVRAPLAGLREPIAIAIARRPTTLLRGRGAR